MNLNKSVLELFVHLSFILHVLLLPVKALTCENCDNLPPKDALTAFLMGILSTLLPLFSS